MPLECSADLPSISQVGVSADDFTNKTTQHEVTDKFLKNFVRSKELCKERVLKNTRGFSRI